MKVLLIEDSRDVAEVIFEYFEQDGYEMDYAANGVLGLKLATESKFDCIILDLMLPGLDGLSVCKRLRELGDNTPIIMLTARDTNSDMLLGLREGADDYIVKPFNLELLEARIMAVLRRESRHGFQETLSCGALRVCLKSHQVWRNDVEVKLNPSCFKILKLLIEKHPGITLREEIEKALWNDQIPDGDILRKHIYQLRNKLDKPFGIEMIKTIPKLGYQLVEN